MKKTTKEQREELHLAHKCERNENRMKKKIHKIRRIVCVCLDVVRIYRYRNICGSVCIESSHCSCERKREVERIEWVCMKCTIHIGTTVENWTLNQQTRRKTRQRGKNCVYSSGNNGTNTQFEIWQRRLYLHSILCFKSMTNHHFTSLHQNKSVH